MATLKQIEKQITYAEGLLDGFGAAQAMVRDLSGGALELKMPEDIRRWEKRDKFLRDERSILRNAERVAASCTSHSEGE